MARTRAVAASRYRTAYSIQPLGAADLVVGLEAARRWQGYLGLAKRRQRAGIRIPTGFKFKKKTGLKSPHGQLPPWRAQFEPNCFVVESPANNDPDHWTRSRAGSDGSDPVSRSHAY